MSHATRSNSSQLFAAATAITAVGLFLTVSPPAQAHPMLPFPLAPTCSQWGFPGGFTLKQSNGDTVHFYGDGPLASGPAVATGGTYGPLNAPVNGVEGGITGNQIAVTIVWNSGAIGRYTGSVGGNDNGFAHGNTYDATATDHSVAHWDSTSQLTCTTTAAAPPSVPAPQSAPPPAAPPAPPAAAPAARLGVNATGPTTLQAGMTSGYNVTVSNPGDLSAPVELFISFNGNLQQTGQVNASGGFDCTVNNYAGGTTSVHCTVGQFGSKATANITVQGRGSAPGAGQLVVNINSSDPAAQFVQKSQQLNVTIT
jgi:hypothetical protein